MKSRIYTKIKIKNFGQKLLLGASFLLLMSFNAESKGTFYQKVLQKIKRDIAYTLISGNVIDKKESSQIGLLLPTTIPVSISLAQGQTITTSTPSASFKIVFSEAMDPTSFIASDITINGTITGVISANPTEVSPNDGTTFEVTVTGLSDGDVVMISLPEDVVTNVAGSDSNKASECGVMGYRIAVGSNYACAVKDDGTVWCWGLNFSQNFGQPSPSQSNVPLQVPGVSNAVSVVCGANHACVLHDNGTVTCWGANNVGQIGSGGAYSPPVLISGINDAIALAAATTSSCVIHADGTTTCWGNSAEGQLNSLSGLTDVLHFEGGTDSYCVLRTDKTLSCWGSNANGNLDGASLTSVEQVTMPIGNWHNCARLTDGTVRCWGKNYSGIVTISNISTAVFVYPICDGNGVVLSDGTVRSWGNGANHCTGSGTTYNNNNFYNIPAPGVFANNISSAVAAFGFGATPYVLLDNGDWMSWGYNYQGETGTGSGANELPNATLISGLSGFSNYVAKTGSGGDCVSVNYIAPPCNAGTSAPALNGATPTTFCGSINQNLDAYTSSAAPSGATLTWSTNADPLVTANHLGSSTVTSAGTYYGFFYDSANSCASPILTVTLSEQTPPNAGSNGTLTICQGSTVTSAQLLSALGGSPDGGGTWSPSLAGAGTYTYTVNATAPCSSNATAQVVVSEQSQPNAGSNGTLTICQGSMVTSTQLLLALGGSPNGGGTWSPGLAGAGTYTYTVNATAPCSGTSTAEVIVSEQTQPDAGSNGTLTICQGSTVTSAQLLSALGGSPDGGGTWSPGLAGAGIYTYTVNATAPCSGTSTSQVIVSEQTQPDAGSNGTLTICQGSTVTSAQLLSALGGSPDGGGTWSPGLAGAGTYTYTVNATAPCTVASTAQVIVSEQTQPDAGSNGTLTICQGSTVTSAQLLSALGGSPDGGGTWSPGLAGAGTYTYTVNATAPCSGTSTSQVIVSEQTQPDAGSNGTLTICQGSTVTSAQLLSALGGSPDGGGIWSPGLAGAGTYTYTVNATAPCTVASTAQVIVSEQTQPDAGSNGTLTICQGSTVTSAQLLSALGGSPDGGGTWSPGLAGAGTYTYTVNATAPCSSNATAQVVVSEQAPPHAGFSYSATACSISANGTSTIDLDDELAGTPDIGGVWSITTDPSAGSVSIGGGNVVDFNGIANGNYIFTYTVSATAPCTGNATAIIYVAVHDCFIPCSDPNNYSYNCDFDGDGVDNIDDLDDDNDGVLDVTEYAFDLWGINSSNQVYTIDLTTGGTPLIFTTSGFKDIEFAPDGILWGINSSHEVYTIDLTTGGTSLIFTTGSFEDIEFAPDGTLWGLNSSHEVYTIDLTTGGTPLIFTTGSFKDIEFAPDGTLWGINSSNHIYTIDLTTGGTQLMSTTDAFEDIVFAPDGTLWGINTSNQIYAINFLNGVTSLISTTGGFEDIGISFC